MPRRIRRLSELARPTVGRNVLDVRRSATSPCYDWAWQQVALRRREADSWLCQACLEFERLAASSDVDHIIPIQVRPDWRLEFDNTQVVCRVCHRRKTSADAQRYGSSTAQRLTAAQHEARRQALERAHPPRAAPGGEVVSADALAITVAYPARVSPRYWALGGLP